MRKKTTDPWSSRLWAGCLFRGRRRNQGNAGKQRAPLKEDDLDHLGKLHEKILHTKKK